MWNMISEAQDFISISATDTVVPDPGRLIFALRQIGYSLEQAISDLIDNAINAGAHHVLIRFICHEGEISSLAIVDDGGGMGKDDLRNAMRFGSDARLDPRSLGKFGLGLKLASFSHARLLTVVSRQDGVFSGRRWSLEGIRRNWDCEIFDGGHAEFLGSLPWSPIDLSASGTIVIWERIDKLPVSPAGIRYTLRALHRRLALHLGLHFHRFLETGRLRIFVDQQEKNEREHQIRAEIPAMNPFAYPASGAEGFPRAYRLEIPNVGMLQAEGHIWPPNCDLPQYKLGNRAASRQGFYFYRNDRLIQSGGWNGLVQSDSEPHGSLARISIDLPPEYDAGFSLNVQKSSVITPIGFVEAAAAARSPQGDTLDEFRLLAQNVYRKKDVRAVPAQKPLPRGGIPAGLKRKIRESFLSEDDDIAPVDFRWQPLDDHEFFRLDRDRHTVLLNESYRDPLYGDVRPDSPDLPLLKLLMFFLLEADIGRKRTTAVRSRQLENINSILVTAARLEKG